MDTKYLKQMALYALTTIVAIGVMLYVGYHLFYGLTQRVESEPALVSEVSIRLSGDAYIFRDERVLSAGANGAVVPVTPDGARVGVGDPLCRIYDGASPEQLARLSEINSQLAVIEEMEARRLSVRDTAAVDGEIYALLSSLSARGAAGDASALSADRAALSAALSRRALLIGGTDATSAAAALRSEKTSLTASLGTCLREIYAPQSGYYYAQCDGYEAIFTADAALSVTPTQFAQLCRTDPAHTPGAGKLAAGYTWYIGLLTGEITPDELTVGRSYRVGFSHSGAEEYDMTLLRCEEDDAGTLLILSCTRLPASLTLTRSQPVRIVLRDYSGIRLPKSALRVSESGVSGVYILSGGLVSFRAVSVLTEGEDWVLLEESPEGELPEDMRWLRRNDIVITRGRGLKEGRILS